jgi:hypothetical protein
MKQMLDFMREQLNPLREIDFSKVVLRLSARSRFRQKKAQLGFCRSQNIDFR